MNKLKYIIKRKLSTRILCFVLLSVMVVGQISPVYAWTDSISSKEEHEAAAKEENDGGGGIGFSLGDIISGIAGLLSGKANEDTVTDQHEEAMGDAQTKYEDTEKNIHTTTQQTIQNQQTQMDELLGQGGYSNTKLMEAITDVEEIKTSINKYMDVKYMTTDDIQYIKLAMYMSQFAQPLEENLLNVINRLRQASSGDSAVDLNRAVAQDVSSGAAVLKANGTEMTYADLCSYIEDNYYTTPLYKSLDGVTYEAATVQDLFYSLGYKFYIKDTYYVPTSMDFIKEETEPQDVSEMTHESAVSVRTALASVYSGDSKALLPFLDSSLRNGASAYELSSIYLTKVETYQCVLSNSLAVQTALTAVLTEYERLNEHFKEENMGDALGATELGMDSFGNIISNSDGFMVLSAMMNPTLMATDGHEKVNLAAYNYKSAWAQPNVEKFKKVYIKKNVDDLPDFKEKSFFASEIFDLKSTQKETQEAYFLWENEDDIKGMTSSDLKNGDINPAKLLKKTDNFTNSKVDLTMLLFRGRSNTLNIKYIGHMGELPGANIKADYTYIVLPKDNISMDGSVADYTSQTSTYVENDKESYKFKYYTTPQRIGAVELPKLKNITETEIIGLIDVYNSKDTLGKVDMFKKESWDIYKGAYQKALEQAAVDRAEFATTVTSEVCLPNSHLSESAESGTPVSSVVALGVLLGDTSIKDLDTDITIYPYIWLSNRIEQTVTINYQDLLFSIFRNTNSNNEKLKDLAGMSEDDINELKEVKIMEILNRIFYKQQNPITTIMKYIAGLLQSWHMSLSTGNLSSLFYIETDNLGAWFDRLAIICFTIALIVLTIRTAILLVKAVLIKEVTFVGVYKATLISAVLALCPVILLTLMTNAVAYLSDNGMSTASLKYGAVAIESELQAQAEKEDVTQNAELMYFIENFSSDYDNLIEIKKMSDERYIYDTLKLSEVTEILSTLPEDKAYGGEDFVCAFEDHYDESIFYYFLDYYLNLYVSERGMQFEGTTWADDLQNTLFKTRGTMKSIYSSRNFVYGETVELPAGRVCVDDVFGLGMLFYVDDLSAEERGFSYPIEIFDSNYYNHDYLAEPDNTYWSCILDNPVFYNYDRAVVKSNLLRQQKDDNTINVITNLPVDNKAVLENYRHTLRSDLKSIKEVEVRPTVIASETVRNVYKVPTSNFTALEQKIWRVNKNIYNSMNKYFNLNLTNTHDYTDVVQMAVISTFEFNKVFGANGDLLNRNQVEPISIEKESLTMDTVFKAIFNNNSRNMSTKYDLMYELTLNQKGVLTSVVIVIAEVVLTLYVIVRMMHLIQIYIMATISCSLAYGWRRNMQNKAWLGLLWQIVYFLGTHSVLIMVLNLTANQPFGENAMIFFIIALGILVAALLALIIEIQMVMFILKHWRDLGGQIVAEKAHAIVDKLSASIEDGVDAENATIENATTGAPQISNMDSDGDGTNDIDRMIETNTEALNRDEAEAATPNILGIGTSKGSSEGNDDSVMDNISEELEERREEEREERKENKEAIKDAIDIVT